MEALYPVNIERQTLHTTRDNPNMCPICGKVYTSISTMRRHMAIHTGEKPYKCDQCDYRTVRKDNLKSHKIQHMDMDWLKP